MRDMTERRGPGRPPSDTPPKELISIRVAVDTLERYRATGPGWQSRIHDLLTRHAPRRRRTKRGAR